MAFHCWLVLNYDNLQCLQVVKIKGITYSSPPAYLQKTSYLQVFCRITGVGIKVIIYLEKQYIPQFAA